jgi:hypothetical protein
MEKPAKHTIEQEEMLARVAQKRMQINELMAMVDSDVGPMSAITVIFFSIRLAFSLFINFSVALDLFLGKSPSYSTLVVFFPRTLLAGAALVCHANAGESLKNEVNLHYNFFSYINILCRR